MVSDVIYWTTKRADGRYSAHVRAVPAKGWVKRITSGDTFYWRRSAQRRARLMAHTYAEKLGATARPAYAHERRRNP